MPPAFKHVRTVLCVVPLAASLVVALPASADDETETKSKKSDQCIRVSAINGFNAIDNKHLTVSVGANKTYLITLKNNCFDLKWSEDIAYNSTLSWSCTDTKDKIYVNGMSCFIETIVRVEDHKTAKEIVAASKEAEESEE